MSKTNKTMEVLKRLDEHGSITSMEAIKLFGATRLSSIIHRLRKRGYDIETLMVEGTDRYGNYMQYGKYLYHGKKAK